MATHLKHSEKEVIYFVTFTCYKWLPLFELTNSYDSVYKWFSYLTQQRIIQILDYIHHNPVSGKWNLAGNYVDYKYSSAKFYELNESSIYSSFLTHYKDL